jgi:hypothetical protein
MNGDTTECQQVTKKRGAIFGYAGENMTDEIVILL